MAVNIKLTKEQQQYLAVGLLLLGGGGFVYIKYFWLPVSEKIAETRKKIEEVEGKIASQNQRSAQQDQVGSRAQHRPLRGREAAAEGPGLPAVTVTALSRRYSLKLDFRGQAPGPLRRELYPHGHRLVP